MSEKRLPDGEIVRGDAANRLRELPESSVHTVVTSPPYFGMRDYDVDGQIGLEEDLGEYIDTLVEIGAEVRRVLRPDGSWWLNLGDSYNGNSITRSGGMDSHVDAGDEGYEKQLAANRDESGVSRRSASQMGMKRRCKMLIPHRVAIALIDDGWLVRNDAVWWKKFTMPESVKNRLSTTFEFFFHLVLDERYWYDLDAIREPYSERTHKRLAQNDGNPNYDGQRDRGNPGGSHTLDVDDFTHPRGKNPGDVLRYSPAQYEGVHCAVMPLDLAEVPIRATCPPVVCAECETPYVRRQERDEEDEGGEPHHITLDSERAFGHGDARVRADGGNATRDEDAPPPPSDTDADGEWRPDCTCETDETRAGIVLDPFAGVGTSLLAARQLGRRFTGIELNEEYVALAQARVGLSPDDASHLRDDDQTGLAAFSTPAAR